MSRRHKARSIDPQGRRIINANSYRVLERAASRRRDPSEVTSPDRARGEAAPPTLLGGVNGKNIEDHAKWQKRVTIIPSERHLGKMDTGERKSCIGVDWLQGTIPFDRLSEFQHYMNEVCGNSMETYDHGFIGYQASCEWHPFGIKLAWDLDKRNRLNHGDRILLQLTGTSLQCFPAISLKRFFYDLSTRFWFKCSRIDLAFDDFEKIIRPSEVDEYACQGSYKGFRKHKYIGGTRRNGELTDDGIYFGTRGKDGGGKFLRCYGKDIESDGKTNSIRWEVEFTKQKANQVFFDLAMSESLEDFATKIALFIGGSIDFAERSKCGKFNKADRLAFWEQILHHLGSAVLRSAEQEGSIESSMDWVERSVTPSLEKIRTAIGDEMYYQWLWELMDDVALTDKQRGEIIWYWDQNGEPAPF